MTISRPGLCLALILLCATAYTTVPAQDGDSGQTLLTTLKSPVLNLYGVTLGTKIKWGAQLVLYPEAIEPVRVLHAYKWTAVCGKENKDTSNRDLGFVVVSSAGKDGVLQTGELIAGHGLYGHDERKPLTLKRACNSSKKLPVQKTYLLTLYNLQNHAENELYWTNVSKIKASALMQPVAAKISTKPTQQKMQQDKWMTPNVSPDVQSSNTP